MSGLTTSDKGVLYYQRDRLPNEFDWNDEAVAKLKMMWAAGMPASRIAGDLGTTKNSVIAKAHRLKLKPRRDLAVVRANATKTFKNGARKKRARVFTAQLPEPKTVAAEPLPVMPLDVPVARRVKFIDLQPGHCRFFCGGVGDVDGGFCPERGYPWCPHHRAIVSAPRR